MFRIIPLSGRNNETNENMQKRHENELLGSPVHALTLQTKYIDLRTAGY